jgi:hypothetical protein
LVQQMKGLKRLGLGAAALGVALTIAGFVAGSVLAVGGSITMGSGSAEPGGSGTVDLTADVGAPGLGAWTVDISYDSSVVTVADCAPAQGGVCNPAYATDTIRITGASASGLRGETVLGTITFDCGDEAGTSPLTMALDVFADATIGDPTDISPADVNDGEFACEVAPTAGPTNTPGPGGLPPTGFGGSDGSGTNWVLVALVGAGLAALTSLTAFRLSARRS